MYPGLGKIMEYLEKGVAEVVRFCYNDTDYKIMMGYDTHFREGRL
jgi:hypothetical protein